MNASSFGNSDNSRSTLTLQRQVPVEPCVARYPDGICYCPAYARSTEIATVGLAGVIVLLFGGFIACLLPQMDLVNQAWPSMQDVSPSEAIILGALLLLGLGVVGAVLAYTVSFLREGNTLWRALVIVAGVLPPAITQLVLYIQHIGM